MVAIYTLVGKHHLKFHETKGHFIAVFPALHMAPCVVLVFNKYLLTDWFYEKRSKNFSVAEKSTC